MVPQRYPQPIVVAVLSDYASLVIIGQDRSDGVSEEAARWTVTLGTIDRPPSRWSTTAAERLWHGASHRRAVSLRQSQRTNTFRRNCGRVRRFSTSESRLAFGVGVNHRPIFGADDEPVILCEAIISEVHLVESADAAVGTFNV